MDLANKLIPKELSIFKSLTCNLVVVHFCCEKDYASIKKE